MRVHTVTARYTCPYRYSHAQPHPSPVSIFLLHPPHTEPLWGIPSLSMASELISISTFVSYDRSIQNVMWRTGQSYKTSLERGVIGLWGTSSGANNSTDFHQAHNNRDYFRQSMLAEFTHRILNIVIPRSSTSARIWLSFQSICTQGSRSAFDFPNTLETAPTFDIPALHRLAELPVQLVQRDDLLSRSTRFPVSCIQTRCEWFKNLLAGVFGLHLHVSPPSTPQFAFGGGKGLFGRSAVRITLSWQG